MTARVSFNHVREAALKIQCGEHAVPNKYKRCPSAAIWRLAETLAGDAPTETVASGWEGTGIFSILRSNPTDVVKLVAAMDLKNGWKRASLRSLDLCFVDAANFSFVEADLSKTLLYCACLSGANLQRVNAVMADFIRALMCGANCSNGDFTLSRLIKVDATNAKFPGARFTDANISAANFRGANFRNALMANVVARDADFIEANLRGADLRGGNFNGANFHNARVDGANWEGATFYMAVNLPKELEGLDKC